MAAAKKIRIQKIVADSGLCSRRNAEDLVTAGRVKINGEYAETGQSANPKIDIITVDDQPLQTQRKRYVMMYKPFGYHTTTQDPFATRKVVDILEKAGVTERLYPVGRLDKNASGLLLLTNDGEWGNKVIHPSVGFEKEYHAKTSQAMSKSQIDEIRTGIMLKDGPVQARVKAVARGFYSITLKAGRHKIVKRIFKYFDIHVTGLKRVRIGPYKLGNLKEGEVQEIKEEIILATQKPVEKGKVGRPARIFTKKPRYEQREIEPRKGKERRSTTKTSPKIDKEFTKRMRAEQRNPELKKIRRKLEREGADEQESEYSKKSTFQRSEKRERKVSSTRKPYNKNPESTEQTEGRTFKESTRKVRESSPRSSSPRDSKPTTRPRDSNTRSRDSKPITRTRDSKPFAKRTETKVRNSTKDEKPIRSRSSSPRDFKPATKSRDFKPTARSRDDKPFKSRDAPKTFKEYAKTPRDIKPFKEKASESKDYSKRDQKPRNNSRSERPKTRSNKFTASSEDRIKPKPFSATEEKDDTPRRLHSAKPAKPFNKERAIRKVGKKKDPLKPKKGAKKRWD